MKFFERKKNQKKMLRFFIWTFYLSTFSNFFYAIHSTEQRRASQVCDFVTWLVLNGASSFASVVTSPD